MSPERFSSISIEKNEKIEAGPIPERVAMYALFDEEVQPKKDVVYHPGSGHDISPSAAFPGSKVIYVDSDAKSMEAIQQKGYEAHAASALEFDPGPVDILILMNPEFSPEVPSSHVIDGGYVLANNHKLSATDLHNDPKYFLQGVINNTATQNISIDTQNLEDYWKEIDTEEEFQKTQSYDPAFFMPVTNAVKKITGTSENVLTEYKKLLEQTREEMRKENEQILATNPGAQVPNPDTQDALILMHDGEPVVLNAHLPNKKGTADSLFIFKKQKVPSSETAL
ncbi:MAG: hypothetical protein ACREGH_00805 [Minisyncoccia bacterium]